MTITSRGGGLTVRVLWIWIKFGLALLVLCRGGPRQVGPQASIYQPMVIPLPDANLAKTTNPNLLRWSLRREGLKFRISSASLADRLPSGHSCVWYANSLEEIDLDRHQHA